MSTQFLSFPSVIGFLAGYVALCSVLRFRRQRQNERQYPYKSRADMAKMTVQHAFEIQKYVFTLEFPFTAEKALQFALFRTYGIPTISKLLVQTKQFSTPEQAGRRYVDTGVLIGEFAGNAPDSERANAAIARMNYLHNIYRKSGLISNDDMIYTLALFVLEPIRWIKRYEWRELTPMEACALGVFWKSVGDAMEISFGPLPSSSNGWKDGLHWVEELEAWSDAYEERCMVPDIYNKKTADETTALLLIDVPKSLKASGLKVVCTLMDDRLRKAMMYDQPPPSYPKVLNTVFEIRRFFLRYLALPRPYYFRFESIPEKANPKTGRYNRLVYENEPWYVKPTFANRNDLKAWFKWIMGKPIPGDPKYQPEGYAIEDVGPKSLVGKGVQEVEATKTKLLQQKRTGCPFAFG